MINISRSDVWLLQAILYSSREEDATLREIICVGDGINKAIFAPGELQQGFDRLVNANLIICSENKFSLTDSARKKLSHLITNELTVFEAQDEISKIIGAGPWSSRDPISEFDPNYKPSFFSIRDYKKAYRKYNKDMMKAIRNLEKGRQTKIKKYRVSKLNKAPTLLDLVTSRLFLFM